jgi:Winged helix DNA-binding domain
MAKRPGPETAISLARVLRWRVERQLLGASQGSDAVEVARRVCGVHAQLAASAVTAIGLRAPVGPDAVDLALARDRTLVKTWAARGTLHLLAAPDLPTWVAAMSTRTRETKGSWLRYHGVTAAEMADLLAAIPEALGDDTLIREELADRLVTLTGSDHLRQALTQGWGGLLKPAAFKGLLCFGPPRGRNVTFVAPRAWLPQWSTVDADGAVEALILDHLGTYGPADPDEFSRWFDLNPPLARRGFERLGERLAWVEVDGATGAIPREHLSSLREAPAGHVVRLLPAFDPYVVGSLRQLDRVVEGPNRAQVSRPQGWVSPVLVVNGRILGTWQADNGSVTVTQFGPLPRGTQKALDAARMALESAGR